MNIKVNEIEKMVFVATCPRSGSSMDCGILERCGAFGGDTMGIVHANTKGIYENQGLNQLVLAPILKQVGIRSPRGLWTIAELGGPKKELFDHFYEDMTYGMNRQGYEGGVAYFKNGIYTFFFDRINECFPEATWLLPDRDIEKVVKSAVALHPEAGEQQARDDAADYYKMYDHILKVCGDRAQKINNDQIIKKDFEQIKLIVDNLGLVWDEKAVDDWVDPDMWGSTKGPMHRFSTRQRGRGDGNNRKSLRLP